MNALGPVVVRFLQNDGGQLSWTEDGEVSLSCDRSEPLCSVCASPATRCRTVG